MANNVVQFRLFQLDLNETVRKALANANLPAIVEFLGLDWPTESTSMELQCSFYGMSHITLASSRQLKSILLFAAKNIENAKCIKLIYFETTDTCGDETDWFKYRMFYHVLLSTPERHIFSPQTIQWYHLKPDISHRQGQEDWLIDWMILSACQLD